MNSTPLTTAIEREATLLQKVSWILYDWANSGYGLIVVGPIFQFALLTYLLPELTAEDGKAVRGVNIFSQLVPGMAVFALLTAMSSLLVFLTAPVLGAIADIKGWTKGLLMAHAVAGSACTMMMAFLGPGDWPMASAIYVFSSYCFGASFTFYNAFLPKLTRPQRQGSLSGWGFAAGYIGGAMALVIATYLPWRFGVALGGLWWLVFSIPAFIFLPVLSPAAKVAVTRPLIIEGFARVKGTFLNIRQYRMLFLFLVAFLIYNNGIDTAINMSPAFGTAELHMNEKELTRMFLIVQFVAFAGALCFGYLADRVGNKTVIISNLVVWCVAVGMIFLVQTANQYTLLGVVIGLVLGGVQSSSRALMARLAPREIHNEAFGFFSLSGKAVSVVGPVMLAFFATYFTSRLAVLAVLPFLVIGLILILFVKEPAKHAENAEKPAASGAAPPEH